LAVRRREARSEEVVNMRSKSLSLIALAVASVVAAGPSLAQQPIRIGASIAVSGRDKVQGEYVREGYLLCQKHVNRRAESSDARSSS